MIPNLCAQQKNCASAPSRTNLIHVGTGFGRCLHVAHAPLFSTSLCFVRGHLSSIIQVWLVTDQEKGNVFILFHSQNLLSALKESTSAPLFHHASISKQRHRNAQIVECVNWLGVKSWNTWNLPLLRKIQVLWWKTHKGNPRHSGSNYPVWPHSPPVLLYPGCRSAPPPHPRPLSFCSCRLWWARSLQQTVWEKKNM